MFRKGYIITLKLSPFVHIFQAFNLALNELINIEMCFINMNLKQKMNQNCDFI